MPLEEGGGGGARLRTSDPNNIAVSGAQSVQQNFECAPGVIRHDGCGAPRRSSTSRVVVTRVM